MVRPKTVEDDEILEVARNAFFAHGPNVSLAAIAEPLGISGPALLKRFGTKRDLMLQSVLAFIKPEWISQLELLPDERPVRDQIVEVVGLADHFFERMSPAISVLRAGGCVAALMQEFDEPPPVRAHREVARWLGELHAQGRANVPAPEAVASTLLGAIGWRHLVAHHIGQSIGAPTDVHLETLAETMWRSMAPEGQ
jgi:AcrR family transcriptional regulator